MLRAASLPELVIFVFAIISSLLYMTVLALLIYHRKEDPFNKSFFRLFLSLGFSDMGHAFTSYSFTITRTWAWIDWSPMYYHPNFGWLGRACSSLCGWYFGWSQYIGVTAIALNRYCNIVLWDEEVIYLLLKTFEKLYFYVWDEKKQRVALLVQWLLPFAFIAPLFTQDYQVATVTNKNFSYLYATPPPEFYSIYVGSQALCGSVAVVLVAVVYLVIFVKLRNLVQDIGGAEIENVVTYVEIRLLIVGFILFLLMGSFVIIMVFYALAMAWGNVDASAFLSKILYVASTFFSFSNPWLLVAASGAMKGPCEREILEGLKKSCSCLKPRYDKVNGRWQDAGIEIVIPCCELHTDKTHCANEALKATFCC